MNPDSKRIWNVKCIKSYKNNKVGDILQYKTLKDDVIQLIPKKIEVGITSIQKDRFYEYFKFIKWD